MPVYLRPWFLAASFTAAGIFLGYAMHGRDIPPAPDATAPTASGQLIPGEGTFDIGDQFAPGLYQSAESPAGGCSWRRTQKTPTSMQFVASGAPQGEDYVVLRAGETFQTSHCQPWRYIDAPPMALMTSGPG